MIVRLQNSLCNFHLNIATSLWNTSFSLETETAFFSSRMPCLEHLVSPGDVFCPWDAWDVSKSTYYIIDGCWISSATFWLTEISVRLGSLR